ncbi:MAG: transcriptional repressor [Verrucomicrobia bacterium]|nr:transcriptional repressor [Verrucomicrobiota bacterium]
MKRITRQRMALLRVFEQGVRPLTPREALMAARRSVQGLGLATVYRTAKLLTSEGLLKTVELPKEPVRYERGSSTHHHHFRCEDCGRVYLIRGCPGPMKSLAPPGFSVRSHTIILHGACSACRMPTRK